MTFFEIHNSKRPTQISIYGKLRPFGDISGGYVSLSRRPASQQQQASERRKFQRTNERAQPTDRPLSPAQRLRDEKRKLVFHVANH